MGRPVKDKLAAFDASSEAAVTWVQEFLEEYRDELIHLARGRQVFGHFLYGDKLMYEYDRARLVAEISEELADAIVYAARRLDLA